MLGSRRCFVLMTAVMFALLFLVNPGSVLPACGQVPVVIPRHVDKADEGLPIESQSPYSAWKHHVADKPEDTIVEIRYSMGGGAKASATGLVIRCDGFVIVPRSVRDTARNGGTVEVIYPKVDGETEKSRGPVTVSARRNPFTHLTVPYALVKTNGCHVRSLPLLDSINVGKGQQVRLLWAVPKEKALAEVASQKAVIDSAAPALDSFTLTLNGGTVSQVPSGAFVIDEESGAAIGMVTQGGTRPVFMTLARFNVISSEVGLAPDRAAVRLGDRPGILPPGIAEMVWVPGGPVPLDGPSGKDFQRDYGVSVACTPGVWVAVQPVTNGEYRRWLSKELVRRLPVGWTPGELDVPLRREDLPACGMIPADAGFYVWAHHSRLPTEVEWRRAAYTRDTSWIEAMQNEWLRQANEALDLYEKEQILGRELVAEAEMAVAERIRAMKSNLRINSRVNVVVSTTPELDQFSREIQQLVDSRLQEDAVWGQVNSITAYDQDISLFGVKNVLTNASELVTSRIQGTVYAPKICPAFVDADLSFIKYGSPTYGFGDFSFAQGKKEKGKTPVSKMKRRLLFYYEIKLWAGGMTTRSDMTSNAGQLPDAESDNLTLFDATSSLGQTNISATFRCAR